MARPPRSAPPPADVLTQVALAGADDAGGLPVALLGDFLGMVSRAVVARRPLTSRQLGACRALGDEAARQGVALRALLDLYSSSAWRLWRHLPVVQNSSADPESVVTAGEVMLRAVDDAIAALAEGYQLARQDLVRAQESARRELVDDLLAGGSDVHGIVTRARGFGLDLSGPHVVALVWGQRTFEDVGPAVDAVERALRGRRGDAGVLVASKDGRLVVVFAAPDDSAVEQAIAGLRRALGPHGEPGARRPSSQIAVSRPRGGADGVPASYREVEQSQHVATALGLRDQVVHARNLLVFLMVLRDRAGLIDLVGTVLTPLQQARGGALPLIRTLEAYFEAGANTAKTARHLHLSVRATSYRLERVSLLTGYDVDDPADELTLRVAVVGARLLGWPEQPLA